MKRNLGIITTRKIIELQVSCVFPPIPTRKFDYCAIDGNMFDADWDGNRYITSSPQGAGATEIEAINDLLDQMEV